MSVVALTGALKDCLGVLSDALDPTLTVHDADNPEGGDMEALCRSHRDKVLGSRQEVLLQTRHNQLPRLPLQIRDDCSNGVQQRLLPFPANIVKVVSVNAHQPHSSHVSQQDIFCFDLQTGIVIKGQPLGTKEGVGCGEVLVSLKSPVSSAEQVAHLLVRGG